MPEAIKNNEPEMKDEAKMPCKEVPSGDDGKLPIKETDEGADAVGVDKVETTEAGLTNSTQDEGGKGAVAEGNGAAHENDSKETNAKEEKESSNCSAEPMESDNIQDSNTSHQPDKVENETPSVPSDVKPNNDLSKESSVETAKENSQAEAISASQPVEGMDLDKAPPSNSTNEPQNEQSSTKEEINVSKVPEQCPSSESMETDVEPDVKLSEEPKESDNTMDTDDSTPKELETANPAEKPASQEAQSEAKEVDSQPEAKLAETHSETKITGTQPEVKVVETQPEVKVAEPQPEVKAADETQTEVKVAEIKPLDKVAETEPEVKVAETQKNEGMEISEPPVENESDDPKIVEGISQKSSDAEPTSATHEPLSGGQMEVEAVSGDSKQEVVEPTTNDKIELKEESTSVVESDSKKEEQKSETADKEDEKPIVKGTDSSNKETNIEVSQDTDKTKVNEEKIKQKPIDNEIQTDSEQEQKQDTNSESDIKPNEVKENESIEDSKTTDVEKKSNEVASCDKPLTEKPTNEKTSDEKPLNVNNDSVKACELKGGLETSQDQKDDKSKAELDVCKKVDAEPMITEEKKEVKENSDLEKNTESKNIEVKDLNGASAEKEKSVDSGVNGNPTESEPGRSNTVDSKTVDEIQTLMREAKAQMAVSDYFNAADTLGKACEIAGKLYGDLAKENAELYYLYGCSMLECAKNENPVLGEAVQEAEEGGAEESPDATDTDEKMEVENGEGDSNMAVDVDSNSAADGDSNSAADGDSNSAADGEKVNDAEKKEPETVDMEENGSEVENNVEESKDKDEDEDSSLKVAWEMFELAKLLFGQMGNDLRLSDTYVKLGEVGMESGNRSAIDDMKSALEIRKKCAGDNERLLAETHFSIGLAYAFFESFDEAIDSYKESKSILQNKVDKLKAKNDQDPEIKEISELFPDLDEKISDVEDSKKAKANLEKTGEQSNGQKAAPFDADSSSKPASNISHLVKRKRKLEEVASDLLPNSKQQCTEVVEPEQENAKDSSN